MQTKRPVPEFLFNKVSAATLSKKRLWHRIFHANFAKFLRTRFLQKTSGQILLEEYWILLKTNQGLSWKVRACVWFFRKKAKKGQNIRKFGQKYTKFENILKNGNLMRATIACMKQLGFVFFLFFEINLR